MPARFRAQMRATHKRLEGEKVQRDEAKKEQREKQQAEKKQRCTDVVEYFDATYGRDATNLSMWRKLCEHVGISPEDSVSECTKALKKIFINIFDLVEARKEDSIAHVFPTKDELRDYSWEHDKIFPLKKAKKNPILKMLLIDMFLKL
ncbi:hypothetical protein LTR36_008851 [Oleoguttula mirabilis]|uniref:Uncharacterized protein n=1 Tax=Oleoguttula mirabilis TaxID=1507867 RepID=A0AAV9J742_9PEZI|nr:hypothetical protein LTR36_008851 [Oleoguttula mirabilis]